MNFIKEPHTRSHSQLNNKRKQEILDLNDKTAAISYAYHIEPSKRIGRRESARRFFFANQTESNKNAKTLTNLKTVDQQNEDIKAMIKSKLAS